jgi:hypothetical protein
VCVCSAGVCQSSEQGVALHARKSERDGRGARGRWMKREGQRKINGGKEKESGAIPTAPWSIHV